MNQATKEYIQAVEHEIEQLSPNFTGNIEFRFNFKEGSCANMNVILGKSLRLVSIERK